MLSTLSFSNTSQVTAFSSFRINFYLRQFRFIKNFHLSKLINILIIQISRRIPTNNLNMSSRSLTSDSKSDDQNSDFSYDKKIGLKNKKDSSFCPFVSIKIIWYNLHLLANIQLKNRNICIIKLIINIRHIFRNQIGLLVLMLQFRL